MSDMTKEEKLWFIKGSARFVTEDGSEETINVIMRNIVGDDPRVAADMALNDYKIFLEYKGKRKISEIDWNGTPEISSYDPYRDL